MVELDDLDRDLKADEVSQKLMHNELENELL